MQKIDLPERPNWRDQAAELGFSFADMHGAPYWDETSAYAFTLDEIETRIEDPATELHALCRAAVDHIAGSEEWMEKLAIPRDHWDFVAQSWRDDAPELYGRFDLAYDGEQPAKLLEYNADTPTSLYESASFQWLWLEQQIAAGVLPHGSDQFNRLHEALAERFAAIAPAGSDFHFAADADNPEDYATVEALAWAARDAGMGAQFVNLGDIGITDEGQLADEQSRVIGRLFKLYPWEDMLRDDFAPYLATSGVQFLEPAWKALVSNKGILPLLWQMAPGHPNLLPAFFESDWQARPAHLSQAISAAEQVMSAGHVSKPIFSREGAGVRMIESGQLTEDSGDDTYDDHPRILQAMAALRDFGGFYPIMGVWIIGHQAEGLGIREDQARITHNLSRFKPHFIQA